MSNSRRCIPAIGAPQLSPAVHGWARVIWDECRWHDKKPVAPEGALAHQRTPTPGLRPGANGSAALRACVFRGLDHRFVSTLLVSPKRYAGVTRKQPLRTRAAARATRPDRRASFVLAVGVSPRSMCFSRGRQPAVPGRESRPSRGAAAPPVDEARLPRRQQLAAYFPNWHFNGNQIATFMPMVAI